MSQKLCENETLRETEGARGDRGRRDTESATLDGLIDTKLLTDTHIHTQRHTQRRSLSVSLAGALGGIPSYRDSVRHRMDGWMVGWMDGWIAEALRGSGREGEWRGSLVSTYRSLSHFVCLCRRLPHAGAGASEAKAPR